jgi:AraC-like DNA-binding protein
MVFSFLATGNFDFLSRFANEIHAPVNNGLLIIPEYLGHGYIRKLEFGPDFIVIIHRYILKEELTIKRNSSGDGNDLVTMFFYSNEQPVEIAYNNKLQVRFSHRDESAIQVTSNDLNSSVSFPANQPVNYVVVRLNAPRLKSLLSLNQPNQILETITTGKSSFLFFERMTAETKLVLKNIGAVNMNNPLSSFYMQIKVEELLYLLFHKLSLRESTIHQAINSADAETLLFVRDEIISDLSVPPVLRQLAHVAAMSETKLKKLFKQTFGTTIYNYYQQARMEEAAFLLKQGKRSVAEVGYEIGFSNLSHFSRVFEKHYGINPKRFSNSGNAQSR